MTELVKGYEEIHVYVEHPIDDHLLVDEGEDVSKGVQLLAVEQGPMGYYSDYSDENDNDDHDRGEFYSFHHYKKKNIIQQVLLQKKKKWR